MSWRISGHPEQERVFQWAGACHLFVLVTSGFWTSRWMHRGEDTVFECHPGGVDYFPADGELHTVCTTAKTPSDVFFVAVPRRHLADLAAADEVDASVAFHTLLMIDDTQLRQSLSALAAADASDESSDEHARALVLRTAELMGCGKPAWHRDRSAFPPRMMNNLVDYIDAHLGRPIPLMELANTTGLSPNHFARKFRRLSGLSLQRFANLRRTQAAIHRLQHADEDLARMALELGFSSQSHLTRVFSELTGISPARFRRQFRRSIG